MRRLLIVLSVLIFCSASSWADSIEMVDVVAWATFTATQPCSSNCTETLGLSFQYIEPAVFYQNGQLIDYPNGEIVPGSLEVGSSGFLGSFYGGPLFEGFIPFWNSVPLSASDEIDLDIPGGRNEIQTGVNTLALYVWACRSQACISAYGESGMGPDFIRDPTSESTVVTAVAVPDGTSLLSLGLTAFGAIGLAWRWRRKESSAA